ncbi:MAG TPA: adenylate/guanylate cyclase domain-containing protein [Sphingobium sp.]
MPINDLNRLNKIYAAIQNKRIDAMRGRIKARVSAIKSGRAIPSRNDLAIGIGRRIEASIIFLDISGFTKRPSNTQFEQELNIRVLTLFFNEIIKIVEDYGGTVEKNTGDGIMAYFGPASGRGDTRQRAVACAMTIFHAGDNLINPIIVESGLDPLLFRVCADFGWITITRMGAAQRFNHIVAVGTPANRTAKMLGFAQGGQIMIGQAMLPGLPDDWCDTHVSLATFDTGWTLADGSPYGFWLFDGRWTPPDEVLDPQCPR